MTTRVQRRGDDTIATRCPPRRGSAHAAEDSATPSADSSGPARPRVFSARAAVDATRDDRETPSLETKLRQPTPELEHATAVGELEWLHFSLLVKKHRT